MSIYTIADKIVDSIDASVSLVKDLICGKTPHEIYDIETVNDARSLVAKGINLVSVIELKGTHKLVTDKEYGVLQKGLFQLLAPRLSKQAGHRIKVYFESDPDQVEFYANERLSGARLQAKSMGLNLDDIFDEKVHVNSKYCQAERVFISVVTERSRFKEEHSDTSSAKTVSIKDGQKCVDSIDSLNSVHREVTEALLAGLGSAYFCKLYTSDDILIEQYQAFNGSISAAKWQPERFAIKELDEAKLKRQEFSAGKKPKIANAKDGDSFVRSVNENNNRSFDAIAPRALADQIIPTEIIEVGHYVISGDRIFAPVHIAKHAYAEKDFDILLSNMGKIPYRIAFTLTPDGLIDSLDSTLAGLLSWAHENNRLKDRSRRILKDLRNKNIPDVGLSITAVTWAPLEASIAEKSKEIIYSLKEIESRYNKLKGAFNDWGGASAAATAGDLTEVFMSTIPGLINYHCVPKTAAPLHKIISFLPISRPSTIWDKGAMLYRSPDGKLMSYEQLSDKQSAGVTVIVGPMGYAKSSQMNALNLAFITEPSGSPHIPYLRGIDFHYSLKGVVDIVESSLPLERKHEAKYVVFKNHPDFGFNVFDLPLGDREPLQDHKDMLVNFLQTATAQISDYSNHQGLCAAVINEAYKFYSDENHNPNAKKFSRTLNKELTDFLITNKIEAVNGETTVYTLVDTLYKDYKNPRMASIAQRYAVPKLEDLSKIVMSSAVRNEYPDEFKGISVCDLFARAIRERIDELPMLKNYTVFDISESPIFIADLNDLVPATKGESTAVKAALIYLAVMHLLFKDIFTDKSQISLHNPEYIEYHSARINKLTTLKKRAFADERSRIAGIQSAVSQINNMIVVGRKFKIDVLQGSQVLSHFDGDTLKLVTSFYICGSGSAEETDKIAKLLDLHEGYKDVIANIQKPSRKGAEMFAYYKTSIGIQSHHLVNTEGPLMLCAIATEQEDRFVRGELYRIAKTSALARKAFAAEFPGGRVIEELNRRKALFDDGLYQLKHGTMLDDIIADVVRKHNLAS